MDCPKCSSIMEAAKFNDIEYEKCSGCEGLWFNDLEHEVLKTMRGSEAIDTGDAKDGALNNDISNYACPHCQGKMVSIVDKEQPHIWFEVCHSCFGVFFDAGEFQDYKEYNLFDFLGTFFARERK